MRFNYLLTTRHISLFHLEIDLKILAEGPVTSLFKACIPNKRGTQPVLSG